MKEIDEATQLIVSELHEAINAGGSWEDVREALKQFATAIMKSSGVVVKP